MITKRRQEAEKELENETTFTEDEPNGSSSNGGNGSKKRKKMLNSSQKKRSPNKSGKKTAEGDALVDDDGVLAKAKSDLEKALKEKVEAKLNFDRKHAEFENQATRSRLEYQEVQIQRDQHKLEVGFKDIALAHYENLLYPAFNKANNLMKRGNGLGKMTKRVLQRLRHPHTRKKVIFAQGFRGGNSLDESECGSTITCSSCLKKTRIGRKRVFRCSNPRCKKRLPRDVNPTRVIIIKFLTRIAKVLQKFPGGVRRSNLVQQKGRTEMLGSGHSGSPLSSSGNKL